MPGLMRPVVVVVDHVFAEHEDQVRFLTEIGLTTFGGPPAQLGVLLQAREAMTEIADRGGIRALPAPYILNESAGYAIADPDGETAAETAGRVMLDLSERVLHLDGSSEEMVGL